MNRPDPARASEETVSTPKTAVDVAGIAREIVAAADAGTTLGSLLSTRPGFDLDAAYAVEGELKRMREGAGHRAVGRKVGYANKAVWRILKLDTLVWAHMYGDTVHYADANVCELALPHARSLKIEPEVVFSVRAPITSELADTAAALAAVEWMAFGFEIIDCPYPTWQFQPSDFVAPFGLHAALIVGDRLPITSGNAASLADALAQFKVRMVRNGEFVEEGSGRNALRSPALCLAELAKAVLRRGQAPLGAGELVSTGTLTAGNALSAGETWTAELEGLPLPNLTLRFV